MKKITLIIVVFFVINMTNGQTWNPTHSNVDYVGNSNTKQMLDIYIPSGVTQPTATIVHIHGGAFMMGSKGVSEQASFKNFFDNGYICVDINYRLSSDSIWPSQIYDCKAAIRFLKANASIYNIDTCKIGVIGESAGGYLVSMLGTTAEVTELEGLHLGNVNVSSRVHAVVDLFGPINFLTMDEEASVLGFVINTNAATSPESKLMGAAVQTIPELVARANPTTYVSADDASFFISAGSLDRNIPYTQGQNFNNALQNVIGSENSMFELIEGAGHGGSAWFSTEQKAKYLSFFNTALTGCNVNGITNSFHNNNTIMAYPNPVKETLYINLPTEKSFEVIILNCQGQVVRNLKNVTNPLIISCESIPNGVYLIKGKSSDDHFSIKFVKQ